MIKYPIALFCLIMSQLSFAQTNRKALMEEAYKALPYFIYATAGKLDDGFYLSSEVKGFSDNENRMLNRLIKHLSIEHGKYKLVFCGPGPCYDKYGEKVNFEVVKGEELRTAVTSSEMDENIYINLSKLNDPKAQIDFVEAVQLLIHEVSRKIPGLIQEAFDTLDAKIIESIRNGYSTFKINDNRKIHVLTIDRPNRFDITQPQQMKTFWINSQGFEVTTFDETEGYFRHVEEVRHQFASPDLMKATATPDLKDAYGTLAGNSILGIEVDRFNDSTTVIRIAADQNQLLLKPDFTPEDVGAIGVVREIVINLKDHHPPQISRRQGYLPAGGKAAGHLTSFEVVDSVLTGTGILPYRLGDMMDVKLALLVRTRDGLLNIPLTITSRNPNGPVVFKFERKFAEEREAAQLIATDILVSAGSMIPLNKIALDQASTISLKSTMRNKSALQLNDVQIQKNGHWTSIKQTDNTVNEGENNFRFILSSTTLLQEMTVYLDHSRQVYNPNHLKALQQRGVQNGRDVVSPTAFDLQISSEFETDVFRVAAPHMKQSIKDGILTVDVALPVRRSMFLEKELPYFETVGGTTKQVSGKVEYGVDANGVKVFSKLVVVNEGLQKISVSKPDLSVKLSGKTNEGISKELWKEYQKAFVSLDDSNPASPFCRDKLK